jgi:hypothetical protein
MRWQGSTLITPVSQNGILDLEFAKTPERLHQLQLFWNSDNVTLNILLDFLFIASYTWFFIAATMYIKQKLKWETWSDRAISMAVAAACFDVLENFLMLLTFSGRFQPSVMQVVYYCAVIKFILVGFVVLFLLIAFPLSISKKRWD